MWDGWCIPTFVRAQFEGAAVFATSIALMGEITAVNGRVQQSNYDDYPGGENPGGTL